MRITALETQANSPERINVFVDGQFFLGVYALVVERLGLEVEQEVSDAVLEQLRAEETEQKSMDRALNYLSFRPRSQREIRQYLRRDNTAPEIIEAVLQRLSRLELVDDRQFANFWLDSRERFRPKGAQALKYEPHMKGVERDIVDEVVNDDQDEERAMRAGQKKAMSLSRLPNMDFATFRNRLGSFLQRRGFSYEITKQTVKKLWTEIEGEEGESEDE